MEKLSYSDWMMQNPGAGFTDYNNYANGIGQYGSVPQTQVQAPAAKATYVANNNSGGTGLYDSMVTGQNLENKLSQQKLDDLQGTDWLGYGGLAVSGANTLMQMGMYKDQKDYLKSSLTALKDNTRNANEAHRYQIDTKKSYGSMFSNA